MGYIPDSEFWSIWYGSTRGQYFSWKLSRYFFFFSCIFLSPGKKNFHSSTKKMRSCSLCDSQNSEKVIFQSLWLLNFVATETSKVFFGKPFESDLNFNHCWNLLAKEKKKTQKKNWGEEGGFHESSLILVVRNAFFGKFDRYNLSIFLFKRKYRTSKIEK